MRGRQNYLKLHNFLLDCKTLKIINVGARLGDPKNLKWGNI